MKLALRIGLPLLALTFGVGGAVWLVAHKKSIEPVPQKKIPPLIEVVEVTLNNHQPVIRSQGRVLPRREVSVMPRVRGEVVEVSAKLNEGFLVDAGEVLVRIDEEDHRLNIRQAEADILSAKASMTSGLAQVANAQAQARQAEARLATEQAEADAANEEWRLLGKTGNPPALLSRQPQIREARSAIAAAVALVDSATAGIESGKASLAAAEAAKERALLDLKRCIIRAPFDARVVRSMVDLASTVSPGGAVAVLQRIDFAEVRLPLSRRQMNLLGSISEAKKHLIHLTNGTQKWSAKFERMLGEVDATTHTQNVIALVANPYTSGNATLEFGAFVTAEMRGETLKNVTVIPELALQQNEEVYLLNDGKLTAKPVRIIERNKGEVFVTGLNAKEYVCVTQLDSFVSEMSVRIRKGD